MSSNLLGQFHCKRNPGVDHKPAKSTAACLWLSLLPPIQPRKLASSSVRDSTEFCRFSQPSFRATPPPNSHTKPANSAPISKFGHCPAKKTTEHLHDPISKRGLLHARATLAASARLLVRLQLHRSSALSRCHSPSTEAAPPNSVSAEPSFPSVKAPTEGFQR